MSDDLTRDEFVQFGQRLVRLVEHLVKIEAVYDSLPLQARSLSQRRSLALASLTTTMEELLTAAHMLREKGFFKDAPSNFWPLGLAWAWEAISAANLDPQKEHGQHPRRHWITALPSDDRDAAFPVWKGSPAYIFIQVLSAAIVEVYGADSSQRSVAMRIAASLEGARFSSGRKDRQTRTATAEWSTSAIIAWHTEFSSGMSAAKHPISNFKRMWYARQIEHIRDSRQAGAPLDDALAYLQGHAAKLAHPLPGDIAKKT